MDDGPMIPVAVAFLWAAAGDPASVLGRVLVKVHRDFRRIPNYTCVETVTREYFRPLAPVRRDCDVLLEMKKNPTLDMKLRPWFTDRLRLEVVMTDSGELHAWVGAKRFEDGSIDTVVRNGPIGTGIFAAFLSAVFEQDVRRYQFEKQVTVDGRERLQFSFSVPEGESHYKVRIYNSWVITAYRGTVEIDPEAEELTRIWIETAILPPAAGTCRSTSDLQIAMTQIGDGRFPLTSFARQHYVAIDGGEAVNTTRFSDCREYRGESTITFGERPAPSGPGRATAPPAAPPQLPPGMRFAMSLEAAIDSGTAAAGDRFTARLETPIRDAAHGGTYAPRGAKVEGRVLRVEVHHPPKEELIVVLRPESVEVRGVRIPLVATQDLRPVMAARKKNPRIEITLPFEWEMNAAVLRLEGNRATLPKGYETHWRTVAR